MASAEKEPDAGQSTEPLGSAMVDIGKLTSI